MNEFAEILNLFIANVIAYTFFVCRHSATVLLSCIFTMKLSSKLIPACHWMQFVSKWAAHQPWAQGCIPIAPHLLFPQFLNDNDPKERELGLFFGNAIMSKCSEIWVFGSHISPGMEAEIKRAKWKNYRLRYFTENLEEV